MFYHLPLWQNSKMWSKKMQLCVAEIYRQSVIIKSLKNFSAVIIFLISVVLIYSCRERNKLENIKTIRIGFTDIKNVDISDSTRVKIISLETNASSLMYDIDKIDFLEDKILLFNKNNVIVFDTIGKFLFNVGQRGIGPGEYLDVTSFFVKNNFIYLFDASTQKILAYDNDGTYISSAKLQSPYEALLIYPIENEQMYIAKNKYQGSNEKIPGFSIYNEHYKKTEDINNTYVESSNFDFNCFYSFQNKILYWKFLNDTIFSIVHHESMTPEYIIDFQNYAIPNHIRKGNDTEEIIEYVNNSNNPNLATLIRYIQEDSLYIRFGFIQKEAILNYVRYHKNTHEVEIRHIIDSKRKMIPNYCFLYKDDKIIFPASFLNDNDDNPSLVFINERDFWD
jgi:hypothetical protein